MRKSSPSPPPLARPTMRGLRLHPSPHVEFPGYSLEHPGYRHVNLRTQTTERSGDAWAAWRGGRCRPRRARETWPAWLLLPLPCDAAPLALLTGVSGEQGMCEVLEMMQGAFDCMGDVMEREAEAYLGRQGGFYPQAPEAQPQ